MEYFELLEQYNQLTNYQKDKINREVLDFIMLNNQIFNHRPIVCPHCMKETKLIKKGFSHHKQRYLCKNCNHKFTYDSHMITSYMKIGNDEFIEICRDTLTLVPIAQTASRLNRSIPCVFYNRHKFLSLLEDYIKNEEEKVSGTIEFDETYIHESNKGSQFTHRKARHRGEPAQHRGISKEQICIVTTSDRNTHEIFLAVGKSRPTKEIIHKTFDKYVDTKSIIYTDGTDAYDELAEVKNCKLVHLKGHESYNKVEHLNVVNCIHTMIKNNIRAYRGVATKYINRYASLFVFMRRFLDMDFNELNAQVSTLIKRIFKVTREEVRIYRLFQTHEEVLPSTGPLSLN